MAILRRPRRSGKREIVRGHVGADRKIWNTDFEIPRHVLRRAADGAPAEGRGTSGENDDQAGVSTGLFHFSKHGNCGDVAVFYHDSAEPGRVFQVKLFSSCAQFNFQREVRYMDNVTLIRVVSGVLAVVVFFTLVYRMKKKAPR